MMLIQGTILMNDKPNIAGTNYESFVDGPGVRAVIFFAGCNHYCEDCQNEDIQDPDVGKLCTDELLDEIADEINKRPFLRGITLSGGDPFLYPDKLLNFILALSKRLGDKLHFNDSSNFDIWIYTGYTWEELLSMHDDNVSMIMKIKKVSVIVDGRFEKDLADKRLKFKGSKNQRLIDVHASLKKGQPVIWRNTRK